MSFDSMFIAPGSILNPAPSLGEKTSIREGRRKSGWGIAMMSAILLVIGTSRALASSVIVNYTATNVSGSEWRYDYTLSGSYLSGDDLAIYFPIATSTSLSDLQTGGGGWTTFALQPDPSLPADGEFDIFANINNPSLLTNFSVLFQWTGSGGPGAQAFTLYDQNFHILTSGATQPNMASTPEPTSIVLVGLGLALLWLIILQRSLIDSNYV